jgi:hypothetical protein
MGLYCTTCCNVVPNGFGQCLACKAGHVPQLACATCRRTVQRGATTCPYCDDRSALARQPVDLPRFEETSAVVGFVAPLAAPPALPGLPPHVSSLAIPESYSAGKFGVTATVRIPPQDVEIMNQLGQLVVLLHTMAQRMNSFQGHSEHTRTLIRAMRVLATDVQDEIETRTGPAK